mmetsp:Transcript_19336/g.29671  ORF Transcript_19336/g.29671 Transcript_19336/m.29671 type:complete len:165 (+) Transcript_19336:154-648(+)
MPNSKRKSRNNERKGRSSRTLESTTHTTRGDDRKSKGGGGRQSKHSKSPHKSSHRDRHVDRSKTPRQQRPSGSENYQQTPRQHQEQQQDEESIDWYYNYLNGLDDNKPHRTRSESAHHRAEKNEEIRRGKKKKRATSGDRKGREKVERGHEKVVERERSHKKKK